jgi:hypothetical protein
LANALATGLIRSAAAVATPIWRLAPHRCRCVLSPLLPRTTALGIVEEHLAVLDAIFTFGEGDLDRSRTRPRFSLLLYNREQHGHDQQKRNVTHDEDQRCFG